MGYANKVKGVSIAVAVMAASAGMLFLGDGLRPWWPLMWVAPLPVLVYALRRPARHGAAVAIGAWLLGGLNLWSYMHGLGTPLSVWLLDFGTGALVFAAGVLLMRGLARRGAVWAAWVALPAVWVTFEYVRNLFWPHGSSACIAYSQLNFVTFLQWASVAGPWGMGFVLLLFASGVALGIGWWGAARGQALRVMGATMGVMAAVMVFGAVRLAIPQAGPMVTVGLVASDANGGAGVQDAGAPTQRLFTRYAAKVRALTARGAQVVVTPEHVGVALDADVAATDAILQPLADETGALVVAGVGRMGAAGSHNEARVYAPGTVVRTYDKVHLLPPWETDHFTPGNGRLVFAAPAPAAGGRPSQKWGVAICKDMDFTEPARAYGLDGVGLMLVPAWDFHVDAFWHGHIAVMRAVEDGFSLVRSARGGLLTVTDDRGRVVAETPSASAEFATLLAQVPTGHSWTLFQMIGDGWAWGAMALLALVVARLMWLRVQAERVDERG